MSDSVASLSVVPVTAPAPRASRPGRSTTLAGILLAGLALGVALARAADQPGPASRAHGDKKHRVVFHVNVDQEERWQEVLTNVENVQKAFGPENVEIEVVTHGAGIGLVQARNVALRARVEQIAKTGPVFAACSNTLHKKELGASDLDAGVKVVDSGLAEVIRRQEEGWTYVKLSH
jgi:intracellular sulfur oxidation DsrE/DsrF family protein